MRSDYLDVSNPYLLRAFFAYCDVANKAREKRADLSLESIPVEYRARAASTLAGMMESMRLRALTGLFELFGGEFKASFPSSWSKR